MAEARRLQLTIRGAVQGVGFRPFVYRIARQHHLCGFIQNSSQGVEIEVEGSPSELDGFLNQLHAAKPPAAWYQDVQSTMTTPLGAREFEIRPSQTNGRNTAVILPDLATCPQCVAEIFDPNNCRYHYPFTNCTNCGPRYTIIESLPYDRPATTMHKFVMCDACEQEYTNPADRRFHAQPNACPHCGPHLECWTPDGQVMSSHETALLDAVDHIRRGKVVAVKGLGGFHLMVDARNHDAIRSLRSRKHRPHKPFALMMRDLKMAVMYCRVSKLEGDLLTSSQAPIVLLERSRSNDIASNVAPDTTRLGVMLPYTPLHHLLMAELGFPIVATSGNLANEPICIDEYEALNRLSNIADIFLIHNRPIVRPVDDSVVQVIGGQSVVLRRARGYAPLPITSAETPGGILAVGGHLKNTVALSIEHNIIGSQHIGDLATNDAYLAFTRTIDSLGALYSPELDVVVCDLHPDYASSQYAETRKLPVIRVQHHYAHALACMLDNQIKPPFLAIVFDGTGFGTDRTVWGGEFLRIDEDAFERVGHLRTFGLPGGSLAINEPRRSALGLLYSMFGENLFGQDNLPPLNSFTAEEIRVLRVMLSKSLNTPLTSSAGRLFDAVASLLGLCQCSTYEGQAAIILEATRAEAPDSTSAYPFNISNGVVDWMAMLQGILDDMQQHRSVGYISGKFHRTLAEMMVAMAHTAGESQVVLTGGCFQNKYLAEYSISRLQEEGFAVHWHKQIPPNDGGIAYGQILAVERGIHYVSGDTRSDSRNHRS